MAVIIWRFLQLEQKLDEHLAASRRDIKRLEDYIEDMFQKAMEGKVFFIKINSLKKLKFFERFFQKFIFYRKTNKKVFKKH